jgi:uncharacterized membrane-anchored protein
LKRRHAVRPIIIAVVASVMLATPTLAAMDCSKDMKAAEDAAAKAPKDISETVMKLLADASAAMKSGDMGKCSEMLGQAYDKLGMKKN